MTSDDNTGKVLPFLVHSSPDMVDSDLWRFAPVEPGNTAELKAAMQGLAFALNWALEGDAELAREYSLSAGPRNVTVHWTVSREGAVTLLEYLRLALGEK